MAYNAKEFDFKGFAMFRDFPFVALNIHLSGNNQTSLNVCQGKSLTIHHFRLTEGIFIYLGE